MNYTEKILNEDIDYIFKSTKKELDCLSGKKVLLTGGAGFLGYELSHILSKIGLEDGREPLELTIYDNMSRGQKEWLTILSKNNNVKLFNHDITKPLPIEMPDFDYIIHAASIASPLYYRKFPIKTIDANVNGLRSLLDYSKKRSDLGNPILGMLYFSTSEIYGDPSPDSIPTSETYRGFVSCTGPRACYDESKRLGETLCVNYSQVYDLPIKVARPFNNYGPGLNINDRRLFPDLAKDFLNKKNLVLLSNGTATRTFCYISDAISGYIKTLINGINGEAYNIGIQSPEISIIDFANLVVKIGKSLFNYDVEVIFGKSNDKKYLTDNPNRRCPDISKAINELTYDPSIDLETGIKKSLLWYSENRN